MILLFLLETTSSNKSDWRYVKSTIDFYYESRICKYEPLYCENKDKLINQDTKINRIIKKDYFENEYKVILVADYDREENKNNRIIDYCNKNKYELIWMNPNIEKVYLDMDVSQADKKRKSENFQIKSEQLLPNLTNILNFKEPLKTKRGSNILDILDKFLKAK